MGARIYFVADGCGSIKIGISTDVAQRLAGLGVANPACLHLLGDIEGDRSQERQVHNALADYRVSGEWFRDCEVVRFLIAEVLAHGLETCGFAPKAREADGHFTVDEARQLADIIIRASGVRVTDPGETFGVPNTLLWRMRYRPGRRIFADEWHLLAEGASRAAAHAAEAAQRDLDLTQSMVRRRAEAFVRAALPLETHRDLPLWRAAEPRP
ncbi:GIY-YIG nuclease family protein [Methylobacterium organophilum]|uniref:Bacteriophage T5 Orf172 DNA-binding domain-containing protein n=1 Tax=Methylobacterium organophilum TaxID=410 RepID=A0ABQ4T5R4_METOR|nr:GIY-YIG nuclease family protein [Methylobacterium organophilum]GJE26255.1 hypothetical protein LKMONMHP_1104 [Methylobacterium organophilum]